MNVQLNGESIQLKSEASLTSLIEQLNLTDKRLAVEVNQHIIPRSQYAEYVLQEGDQIEIVHAIGGGEN